MALIKIAVSCASVAALSLPSNSAPYRSGSSNLPNGAGFAGMQSTETEKTFPVLNIHYNYPATDLDYSNAASYAEREAFVNGEASAAAARIDQTAAEIEKITNQESVALEAIKSSKQSFAALRSTFFPTVNVGVEDKVPEASMASDELNELQQVEDSEEANRHLAVLILEAQKRELKAIQKQKHSMFLQMQTESHTPAVANLVARVNAGGKMASRALAALINLWPNKSAADAMKTIGLVRLCERLMARESTPDYVRGLAGSLVTLLTNTPVASEVVDAKSGSYGHVNIVMPRPGRTYQR